MRVLRERALFLAWGSTLAPLVAAAFWRHVGSAQRWSTLPAFATTQKGGTALLTLVLGHDETMGLGPWLHHLPEVLRGLAASHVRLW